MPSQNVLDAYHRREFVAEELRDRLIAAGLSPEEADQVCYTELGIGF